MSRITVLRPDKAVAPAAPVSLADRSAELDGGVVTLIENGKPHARELLSFLGEELARRHPGLVVETLSKPSASKPIDADQARMLAARSRLVLTGIGD
jgi:hypothetical protein